MAWARLRVDVEAPRFVSLQFEPVDCLRIDSSVALSVADDTELRSLRFRLLESDGEELANYELDSITSRELAVPLGEIMAGKGIPARRNVRVETTLIDRAGRNTVQLRSFEYADFAIPRILDVRSIAGDSGLRVTGGRAEMIVRLSEVGDGTRLLVHARLQPPGRDPIDLETEVLAVLPGAELRVAISAPPFPISERVPFAFTLEDPVGNRSEYSARLRFRNLTLDPEFELVSRGGAVRLRGRKLFCDSGKHRVRYRCNSEFTPMLLIEAGAAARESVREELHRPGLLEFTVLPGEEQSNILLRIAHVLREDEDPLGRSAPGAEIVELEVWRLPSAPSIQLRQSWRTGMLWSPTLLDAEALAEREGGVSLGPALLPAVPREAEARGRLWQRVDGDWLPLPGAESRSLADLRQQVIELARGRQAIALELRDVLGRPLEGRDENARPLRSLDVRGRRILPLLSFRHDDRPPRPAQEILVAWDEEVVVQLEEQAALDERAQIRLLPPQLGTDPRGYPGVLRREGPRRVVRVRMPFGDVARWCGWDGLDSGGFPERPAEERRFIYRTPAGQFPVTLRFRPTRSLLRSQSLRALAGRDLSVELDLLLVPFRGPRGSERFAIGVARQRGVPGSFALDERIEVQGVGEYFLAASETTRAAYQSFLAAIEADPLGPEQVKALGHVEDPLGARRFTRAGLLPDLRLFAERDFEAWVRAAPGRPVTGVCYFQAQAFCRWLSLKAFGDAGLLRLPFAAELEWAALGELGPGAENGLRLGPSAEQSLLSIYRDTRKRAQQDGHVLAGGWPAKAAELVIYGDHAPGLDEQSVTGLEFGVREWCEDVPAFDQGLGRDLFRRIASNLTAHRDFTRTRRTQRGAGLEAAFQRWLRLGVVRGLAWGEPDIAGDAAVWLESAKGPFRERVFGVRRSVQIARDGSGLTAGSIDPMVQVIGFRVAGSRRFLERVRRQVR